MLTRRSLLLSVPLLGATTAAYAVDVEPTWYETVIQPISLPHLTSSLRLLQLSDLHASSAVPLHAIKLAIRLALAAKPDLICLTGDFVTRVEPLDAARYSQILAMLSSAAPTFATLGNHDGSVPHTNQSTYPDTLLVRSILQSAGITLLHNTSTPVTVGDQTIRLAGVGDLWAEQVDPAAAFDFSHANCPTVLMAHNPDTKDLVSDRPWDLMLSGHTHGGQVLIPLIGERYAPVRDKRFVAGLKHWNGRQIYITRGVGSLAGVRFRCRPEITVLDLQPKLA